MNKKYVVCMTVVLLTNMIVNFSFSSEQQTLKQTTDAFMFNGKKLPPLTWQQQNVLSQNSENNNHNDRKYVQSHKKNKYQQDPNSSSMHEKLEHTKKQETTNSIKEKSYQLALSIVLKSNLDSVVDKLNAKTISLAALYESGNKNSLKKDMETKNQLKNSFGNSSLVKIADLNQTKLSELETHIKNVLNKDCQMKQFDAIAFATSSAKFHAQVKNLLNQDEFNYYFQKLQLVSDKSSITT